MKKNVKKIGAIVGVPFAIYMAVNIINGTSLGIMMLAVGLLAVCGSIVLMVKGAWLLEADYRLAEGVGWNKKYYILTGLNLIILPIIGLWANEVWFAGLLGEFSHPAFWIIALINGVLCMMPSLKNKRLRLFLFYFKVVGYSYILYFFVIFLPILPLGILGVLLWGLGLLTFIPTLAMLWEGRFLLKETRELIGTWGKKQVLIISILGLITLPTILTLPILGDWNNFNTAMGYVDGTGLEHKVDKHKLSRALKALEAQGAFDPNGFPVKNDKAIPMLTGLYCKIVFGDRIMPEYVRDNMKTVFWDKGDAEDETYGWTERKNPAAGIRGLGDPNVRCIGVSTETGYDEKEQVYRSWINMDIQNFNRVDSVEYGTYFKIPEGVYVSNYYLVVGTEKKYGTLADKRAVMDLYNSIVRAKRDPGILRYVGNNQLELRVFPFNRVETRKTGFEIIHRGNVKFKIEGHNIDIKVEAEKKDKDVVALGESGITMLSSAFIETLPKTSERKGQYYFLIDGSKYGNKKELVERTKNYIKTHGIQEAKVLLVEDRITCEGIENIEASKQGESGYNLSGVMQYILRTKQEGRYPIIIAVCDDEGCMELPYNMGQLVDNFPESSYYYNLDNHLMLKPYAYEVTAEYNPFSRSYLQSHDKGVEKPIIEDVREYNGRGVKNNGKKQFIITKGVEDVDLTGRLYEDAYILEAINKYSNMASNSRLVEVVKASFKATILSPQTAFMVVETKQQEEQLRKLQEYYLSGEDVNGKPVKMAEPSVLICILGAVILLMILKSNNKTIIKK